jgi:putative phosphoesterase
MAKAAPLLTRQRQFDTPLTIGVVADTHIYPHSRRAIPAPLFDLFRRAGVGLLVHLGDANVRIVLEELADVAPLLAVPGNNDDDELQHLLPATVRFSVGTFSFAAIHGHGGRTAKQVVADTFAGKVDCALFGHSHIPSIEQRDGTILFNPGSATDRRWHEHFGVGLIGVSDAAITPELVLYADPAHLDNIRFDMEPATSDT